MARASAGPAAGGSAEVRARRGPRQSRFATPPMRGAVSPFAAIARIEVVVFRRLQEGNTPPEGLGMGHRPDECRRDRSRPGHWPGSFSAPKASAEETFSTLTDVRSGRITSRCDASWLPQGSRACRSIPMLQCAGSCFLNPPVVGLPQAGEGSVTTSFKGAEDDRSTNG
jgi:hypothetical protein